MLHIRELPCTINKRFAKTHCANFKIGIFSTLVDTSVFCLGEMCIIEDMDFLRHESSRNTTKGSTTKENLF